jgi:hypothetical protein
VPIDDGQQVVEVVGYAAGQTSEALHLLETGQLEFGTNPLGDIAAEALDAPFGHDHGMQFHLDR